MRSNGPNGRVVRRVCLSFCMVVAFCALSDEPLLAFGRRRRGAAADLVVESVTLTPSSPVEGDAIRIVSRVRNRGRAATPVNVPIRVGYIAGGRVVMWGEVSQPLPAGAAVDIPLTGPRARAGAPGRRTLSARVDVLGRIRESNERNNTRRVRYTIRPRAAPPAPAPSPSPAPAPAPTPAPTPPNPTGSATVSPVATTGDPGFFSLKSYQNVLFAGTYGTGKVYSSANGFAGPVANLNVGESVYVMREFGGYLYANTENRGEIWRSRFGNNWDRVFPGEHTAIGTGLVEHGGFLYACYTTLNNRAGRIYRSRSGNPGTWQHVFGNSRQGTDVTLRELIVFQNTIYCLSYDYDSGIGGFYTSTDGRTWTWRARQELRNKRPIKAHVYRGALWISTSPFTNRRVPPSGVYRFDGRRLTMAFEDASRSVGTDLVDFGGDLYFCNDVNWRATSGRAALFRSPSGDPGTWTLVTTFDEAEAMDLEVHGGHLYIATRQQGGHGKVYRMSNIPAAAAPPQPSPTPAPPPAPSPGVSVTHPRGNNVDGPGGFLWKPVSSSDGKLVVLAPASLTGRIHRCNVLRPNGSHIVGGRYTGVHNGGREHFRYPRPGRDYPANAILELVLKNGSRRHYVIPRPGERFD